jgi:hypothetical protein
MLAELDERVGLVDPPARRYPRSMDPVSLPSSSIEPIATAMAKRYRVAAIVPFAAALLFLATSIPDHLRRGLGSTAAMFFLCAFLPVALGCIALAKSRRVDRIGRVASHQPALEWRLTSTTIVATTADGAARTDLSFPITLELARSLRAVPRAVVLR